ncbi:hypothetical protein [Jannaschia sp. R86511]|uniref:hypothetical protein n=1 Tax=Jannaschia sp. R86511 TaxID=3093853 RepID=UPI0036D42C10
MSNRNTVVRVLHDVGAAAWFGGTLMGAVGLNGAADSVEQREDRARVASVGWARWAPVNAAALGAHVAGGIGLLLANRDRAAHQEGTRGNTVAKSLLTVAGVGLTAWSGVLGAQVAKAGQVPAQGAVTPSGETPDDVAGAMRQLRVVQYAIPAVAGVLIALGAQQGEQQKPEEQRKGLSGLRRLTARD